MTPDPATPRRLVGIAAAPGLAEGPTAVWVEAAPEIPRLSGRRAEVERPV